MSINNKVIYYAKNGHNDMTTSDKSRVGFKIPILLNLKVNLEKGYLDLHANKNPF